jgi:hypothetical protein
MIRSHNKYVKGLDPVADAFSGTVYSDILSLKNAGGVEFIVYKGVGTTGTSTVTVEASDDFSASTTAAVAFRYQAVTSGDTAGALTAATTAGFVTTAGSSQLYRILVNAEDLISSGYGNVRLKMVESVDSPVLGGILAILRDITPDKAVTDTVIA